ncbi:septation protein SepH [Planobispora takensis]|uniref:DUF3071 domain-containing protein n=1 Tax=Planobispora takensis TaxID=1367882 RepID=A0A8J3SVN3_9ACTN|nr:septation protein SepH [Planobispora takensis]GIH99610.1 hypothetical protein Pta02_16190 [Planobispora takensis]
MQELRLVAVSEDGTYLVLATAGRGTRFTLPVDDRLRAAVRGNFSRLGQYEIEVESPLRPKEIQARIRAGETAEEIAATAGIPVERVRWFEGPVLQEREYMAQQAQRCAVRLPGESSPGPTLGDLVAERLTRRGVPADEIDWDSAKRDDNLWRIKLGFMWNGHTRNAEWLFDPRRRHITPHDDEAMRLSASEYVDPVEDNTVTPFVPRAAKLAPVPPLGSEPLSQPPVSFPTVIRQEPAAPARPAYQQPEPPAPYFRPDAPVASELPAAPEPPAAGTGRAAPELPAPGAGRAAAELPKAAPEAPRSYERPPMPPLPEGFEGPSIPSVPPLRAPDPSAPEPFRPSARAVSAETPETPVRATEPAPGPIGAPEPAFRPSEPVKPPSEPARTDTDATAAASTTAASADPANVSRTPAEQVSATGTPSGRGTAPAGITVPAPTAPAEGTGQVAASGPGPAAETASDRAPEVHSGSRPTAESASHPAAAEVRSGDVRTPGPDPAAEIRTGDARASEAESGSPPTAESASRPAAEARAGDARASEAESGSRPSAEMRTGDVRVPETGPDPAATAGPDAGDGARTGTGAHTAPKADEETASGREPAAGPAPEAEPAADSSIAVPAARVSVDKLNGKPSEGGTAPVEPAQETRTGKPAEPPAAEQPPAAPAEPPAPAPVPKPTPARPAKKSRGRRASVPTWDEIMFGARRPD